ncbi:uncharacterized protein J3D65DRAFT_676080 [Phyllosticta citribraziliensis]|uniref:Uncharacterized protein n=1 Tax=Phyllosticta citribraziliensis TaxID=989973 RepID=A0ABR1LZJ1_9PEZI
MEDAMAMPEMSESRASFVAVCDVCGGAKYRAPNPSQPLSIEMLEAQPLQSTPSCDELSTFDEKKETAPTNSAPSTTRRVLRKLCLSESLFESLNTALLDYNLWFYIPNFFHFLALWFFIGGFDYCMWRYSN